MKRMKMSKKGSKKLFSKTADLVHKKNMLATSSQIGPMRGGIRL